MSKHQQYPLFIHWYTSMNWLWDHAEKFPRKARFSLASRVVALSLEVLELIIETVYAKNPQKRPKLKAINLNLEKLRILCRVAHERQYLSTQQYRYIIERIDEAGRMTGGWLKSL